MGPQNYSWVFRQLNYFLRRYQRYLIYLIVPGILTAFVHFPVPWGPFQEKYKTFPILANFGFWLFATVFLIGFYHYLRARLSAK